MSCQAAILWESSLQLLHLRQAGFPAYSIDLSGEVSRPQKVALRKISNNDQHQVPGATKAHERNFLSGHAMGLFSAGFPTGAG